MDLNLLSCIKEGGEMPRDLANYMFATDFPEGQEFGIDYKSWKVGPRFCGLKMIPPGIHFVYFSIKETPRIGFFHNFQTQEILLWKWDKSREDIVNDSDNTAEVDQVRANLKNIDSSLGPYPFENYRSWFALSDFINQGTLERINPVGGRITAQAEVVPLETRLIEDQEVLAAVPSSTGNIQPGLGLQPLLIPHLHRFIDESGLPIMHVREEHRIRFQKIPPITDLSSSRAGIDHSARVDSLVNSLGDWKELIAELQYSFVCFLMGQVYEGFEQWKRLIHVLVCCPRAISERTDLYLAFLRVLFFQLKECPKDFFVDIVSRDNFLTTTLSMLFANIQDGERVNPELKKKTKSFKVYLTKNFKWSFDLED